MNIKGDFTPKLFTTFKNGYDKKTENICSHISLALERAEKILNEEL